MNLDLEPIKKAATEATTGPWKWSSMGNLASEDGRLIVGADSFQVVVPMPEDADFVVNSRRWIPQLIDEVEELRARLDYYDRQIAAMTEGPA